MRTKDVLGRYGEELAAEHLAAAGLRILERNWRCSEGEVDIIAADGAVIVFVEVKTRSTRVCGDPAEAVTPAKAARIHRLAMLWLEDQRAADDGRWHELRFDVVAIVRLTRGGPEIRHLAGAF